MPFTLPEALADIPELLALVQSIVAVIPQVQAAKSFADRQKLSEPIQEALAKLIDEISAQVAS